MCVRDGCYVYFTRTQLELSPPATLARCFDVFGVEIFEEFEGLEKEAMLSFSYCAVVVVDGINSLSDGVVTAAGVTVFLEEFSSEAGGAVPWDFAFSNGGGAIEGVEV